MIKIGNRGTVNEIYSTHVRTEECDMKDHEKEKNEKKMWEKRMTDRTKGAGGGEGRRGEG